MGAVPHLWIVVLILVDCENGTHTDELWESYHTYGLCTHTYGLWESGTHTCTVGLVVHLWTVYPHLGTLVDCVRMVPTLVNSGSGVYTDKLQEYHYRNGSHIYKLNVFLGEGPLSPPTPEPGGPHMRVTGDLRTG